MDTKALEKIGLTKNEIKVYLALLELGSSSTAPITQKAGIHMSRVYEALNTLTHKGLVSSEIRDKKSYFTAADPSTFLDIIDEKKRNFEDILPELELLQKSKKEEEGCFYYVGYKGVKSVYDNIVRTVGKREEMYVLGARGEEESYLSQTFFKQYTKRRIAKGIKLYMLFNEDSKKTGEQYAKMKNTYVRYLPKGVKTPAAVNIWKGNVANLLLKSTPVVFLVKSKETAISYKEFFKILWKQSKP